MKLGVIGSGSWGTALAKVFADNGNQIHWYLRDQEVRDHILLNHTHPKYLQQVRLPVQQFELETNLYQLVQESQMILLAVPSAFLESVLSPLPDDCFHQKQVISAIKGLEYQNGTLISGFLKKRFQITEQQFAVIAGPGHAEEVATGNPTFLTIASENIGFAKELQILLQNEYLQVDVNTDVTGVEWSSVLKNIYAILVGMAQGLGYKDNFTSILVSACLREMDAILKFVCPADRNILENVYLGDLLVTAYSLHSRNRRLGFLVGSGVPLLEVFETMQMVAEGYYAVETAHKLVHQNIHQFPLLDAVQKVLYQNQSAEVEIRQIVQHHLC